MASTLVPQKSSDTAPKTERTTLKAPPKPSFITQARALKNKSPKQRLLLIGAILVGLWMLYLMMALINRPTAQVFTARRGVAVSAVYGTIHIEYAFQQSVRADMPGYIELGPNLHAGVSSVGEEIQKGQLLGTIRDENTNRQAHQAQIEYDAVLAKYNQGPGTTSPLKNAQDHLARIEKAGMGVSESERTAARNLVAQYINQVENEKIELQKQLDNADYNLKYWKEQMQRSEIRSPIDGYLVAAPPADDQMVLQNEVIFTIASRRLYVSGLVNEEDVGVLHVGMKAQLKLYSYGNQEFTATLRSVLPNADTSNQHYTVTLTLDDPPENLRAALTGEMNILVGRHENVLIIPTRALRDPDERLQDRVFIVRGSIIRPRLVKIGYRNPEYVEVLAGLNLGDRVVVADQDTFTTGQRVKPISVDNHNHKTK